MAPVFLAADEPIDENSMVIELKNIPELTHDDPTRQNYAPRTSWGRPQKKFCARPRMVLYVTPRDVPYRRPEDVLYWSLQAVWSLQTSWGLPSVTSWAPSHIVLYLVLTSMNVILLKWSPQHSRLTKPKQGIWITRRK